MSAASAAQAVPMANRPAPESVSGQQDFSPTRALKEARPAAGDAKPAAGDLKPASE
jgi:hypothetical protein